MILKAENSGRVHNSDISGMMIEYFSTVFSTNLECSSLNKKINFSLIHNQTHETYLIVANKAPIASIGK